ncbi:MAG: acetyl-CoA carboxylase biotin carboxyl carrier protein subunit, partial [Sphingorhabdus sp.]
YAIAAVIHHRLRQQASHRLALNVNAEMLDWSNSGALETVMQYADGEDAQTIHVHVDKPDHYRVNAGVQSADIVLMSLTSDRAKLRVDGRTIEAIYYADHRTLHLALPSRSLAVTDLSGVSAMEDAGGGGTVVAPMHGLLLEILIETGTQVAKGDKLAVLEAMKMQHEILAEIDGTVETIAATAGKQIAADDLIMEIAALETEETET